MVRLIIDKAAFIFSYLQGEPRWRSSRLATPCGHAPRRHLRDERHDERRRNPEAVGDTPLESWGWGDTPLESWGRGLRWNLCRILRPKLQQAFNSSPGDFVICWFHVTRCYSTDLSWPVFKWWRTLFVIGIEEIIRVGGTERRNFIFHRKWLEPFFYESLCLVVESARTPPWTHRETRRSCWSSGTPSWPTRIRNSGRFANLLLRFPLSPTFSSNLLVVVMCPVTFVMSWLRMSAFRPVYTNIERIRGACVYLWLIIVFVLIVFAWVLQWLLTPLFS